ncbi:MAG: TIGR02452 family protein [Lachnospiraceae bacterium]|nr:TIGR02452 family protein [Lachnospiraceae bacterium]
MRYSRDFYIDRANEIIDACDSGFYILGNKKIPLNAEEGTYYRPDYELNIPEKITDIKSQNIHLIDAYVTDVVFNESYHNKGKTIGVLNFASAHHPGGGFERGAMAQEEAICQSSTLFVQLENNEMYKYNESCKNSLYNDGMIVSSTRFIRDSKFNFVANPVNAIVVTSPAVNLTALKDKTNSYEVMRVRMEKILKQFINYKCNIIILGAFGCGVFGNDPKIIAEIWRDLLVKYGAYFDKVDFAIPSGNNNYNQFNVIFN